MIAAAAALPHKTTRFQATLVWMHAKPLLPGATYLLKHTTQTVRAQVADIRHRIDVEHLAENSADQLALNDIGEIVLEVSRPLLADLYRDNRTTGSFILIDAADNATAGAGMIRGFLDGDETAAGATQPTGAILELGSRSDLAADLEKSLLQARALVLRTRVRAYATLLTVARTGAVVLIESDAHDPITLFVDQLTQRRSPHPCDQRIPPASSLNSNDST